MWVCVREGLQLFQWARSVLSRPTPKPRPRPRPRPRPASPLWLYAIVFCVWMTRDHIANECSWLGLSVSPPRILAALGPAPQHTHTLSIAMCMSLFVCIVLANIMAATAAIHSCNGKRTLAEIKGISFKKSYITKRNLSHWTMYIVKYFRNL